MKTRLTIEIASGIVGGVYFDGVGDVPEVRIVDLDEGKIGGPTVALLANVEPLDCASDIVREAIEDVRAASARAEGREP